MGAHGLPSNYAGVLPDTETTGVQVHSSSKYQKLWSGLKDTALGKTVHGFSRSLEESDNVVLRAWRSLKEKTRSTSESETVQAIKAIRTVEPGFNLDKFFDEAVHFIIPDLLEAHLARDLNVIKNWFSQAVIIF